MPLRTAHAQWNGTLTTGKGIMSLGSGLCEGEYSFGSRFEEEKGTNPEELIGAAHAGCFSMALSKVLEDAGYPPNAIHTSANVRLEKNDAGFAISTVQLETDADVPGIDERSFQNAADDAKRNCPVSQALAGVKISLNARLSQPA